MMSLANLSRTSTISMHVPLDAAYTFGLIFITSGIAAFLINATILFTLFLRRSNLFAHVFYILIFNFAFIDLIKSICSIIWALKLLPIGATSSMLFMKIDQLVLMALRYTNLATILNLLMITINEYIFIVYPLRYRQLVTRWRVLFLIVLCMVLAWTFTLSVLIAGSREQSIYIKPNCIPLERWPNASSSNISVAPIPSSCIVRTNVILETQFAFNMGIIAFCSFCLIISFICYTTLIRVISKIIKSDAKLMRGTEYQNCLENSGHSKRDRMQLLKRNKYVIVIGSVIAIYTVYLISYSAIQILYVGRLTRFFRTGLSRSKMYYVRWIFQSLMCLHSLLQPLCYFRIREFRSMFRNTICKRCRRNSLITENFFLSNSDQHLIRRNNKKNANDLLRQPLANHSSCI